METSKTFRCFVASITLCITVATHVFAGAAVEIVPDVVNGYRLDFPVGTYTSQSMAHLNIPHIKKDLFSDQTINDRIKAIGPKAINEIIKQILNREEEYHKQKYFVFYHGQKFEFMLNHDLIAMLVKILHKKASNDYFLLQKFKDLYNQFLEKLHIKSPDSFVFLRTPGTSGPYQSVREFLTANTCFHDSETDIRNVLLSVNPCLFGNCGKQDDGLSCTFRFFLSSGNVNETDFETWIKKIFAHFKLEYCYERYQKQINGLRALLSQSDPQNTGLLLQIFVPKDKVDQIAFRALPGGMPHHNPLAPMPQNKMPSKELSDYTKPAFFANTTEDDPDAIQYRLLINDVLLNPESKIRIFRYYNRTPSVVAYETGRNKLFSALAREVAAVA